MVDVARGREERPEYSTDNGIEALGTILAVDIVGRRRLREVCQNRCVRNTFSSPELEEHHNGS